MSGRIAAPSLLTRRARAYSDGYIYSIIRYGRGVMPRYGDKVYAPADRWAIVNHVRKLQAQAPAPQEPAGAAAPIRARSLRDRLHRRAASMSPAHRALAPGRAGAVGQVRPVSRRRRRTRLLGLILFIGRSAAKTRPRAWQLFHVNWLYFTGLAGGSVAFAAVQKITNAKWSGLIIRFAEASVAFLPVSLLGLVLIFTLGYHAVYGHMEHALHVAAPFQGRLVFPRSSCSARLADRAPGALLGRLETDTRRPDP